MKNYLIDYYFLDREGNREEDFYETIVLEAENDDDATIKPLLQKYLSEKDVDYWDLEISSIYQEEN